MNVLKPVELTYENIKDYGYIISSSNDIPTSDNDLEVKDLEVELKISL